MKYFWLLVRAKEVDVTVSKGFLHVVHNLSRSKLKIRPDYLSEITFPQNVCLGLHRSITLHYNRFTAFLDFVDQSIETNLYYVT